MASGSCASLSELPDELHAILTAARRGILASVGPDGRPHAVPVVFAERGGELITPIDAKPKSGRKLGRLRNIESNPNVALVVDRWDEDWSRLGWVMVRGTARVEASQGDAELLARYPQYEDVLSGSDAIVIRPTHVSWWTWR